MPIGLKRGLFFGERVEKAGIHTEPAVAGSWNRLVLSGLRGTFLCWWTIWYLSTNYSLHIFNFEQAPNLTCKIPKSVSPGAYIFQRPFWGTYIRRRNLRIKIGRAYTAWEGNLRLQIDWASL